MNETKFVLVEPTGGGGITPDLEFGYFHAKIAGDDVAVAVPAASLLEVASAALSANYMLSQKMEGPRRIIQAEAIVPGIVHQRSDVLSLTLRLGGQTEFPLQVRRDVAHTLAHTLLALLSGEDGFPPSSARQ